MSFCYHCNHIRENGPTAELQWSLQDVTWALLVAYFTLQNYVYSVLFRRDGVFVKYFMYLCKKSIAMQLELLSPAKNYEQGREAINHGADAVYIGASNFGARVAAGNDIGDIEQMARYAHLYHAKVFATVNTLLFDHEVEPAVKLIHHLYEAGVDAVIMQDLGLLECDLPPIELHASTQTHNATVERVRFMEQVGFKRVILARETSLEQMREIRRQTTVDLEAFVQGALCVSYSGQCYMSQYLNERSGNRGCCGQPCRSSYDLYDQDGKLLRRNEHLLSLKDFSAARHLQEMVDAGITSFKIEGRLKDMGYVKNVTAYYRQLLDNIMSSRTDCQPASSGKCEFFFMPDLEKTFNRGFTDYFLKERKPMATMSTQKSLGKKLGAVTRVDRNMITVKTHEQLTSGDGLCFFNAKGELQGCFVNHVQGNSFQPNRMPADLEVGTLLWRNNDQAFEKQLQGKTSVRKIDVNIELSETPDGLRLQLTDADGMQVEVACVCAKEAAQNPQRALDQAEKQLCKMGDTVFAVSGFQNLCTQPYFLPASVLNDLRRQAVALLEEARLKHHLEHRGHSLSLAERQANTVPYFEHQVDYRANVINAQAQQFYLRHGAELIERGVELTHAYDGKALMTTKYCIRYELGSCLMGKNRHPAENPLPQGALYLRNNKNWFQLEFDCRNCMMKVLLAQNPMGEYPKK